MKKILFVFVAHTCVLITRAQGSLQVVAGAFIKSSGGAYLVLDNTNIVNNGSLQQAAGNGFVKLTGGATVGLSGSSNTIIDALVLAKSDGTTYNLNSDLFIVCGHNNKIAAY